VAQYQDKEKCQELLKARELLDDVAECVHLIPRASCRAILMIRLIHAHPRHGMLLERLNAHIQLRHPIENTWPYWTSTELHRTSGVYPTDYKSVRSGWAGSTLSTTQHNMNQNKSRCQSRSYAALTGLSRNAKIVSQRHHPASAALR